VCDAFSVWTLMDQITISYFSKNDGCLDRLLVFGVEIVSLVIGGWPGWVCLGRGSEWGWDMCLDQDRDRITRSLFILRFPFSLVSPPLLLCSFLHPSFCFVLV
jgi:hypothetical protein